MLTPLAIDPGHPFPHLLNKSLNLAVAAASGRTTPRSCSPSCRCRRCCRASCRCRREQGRHVFTPLETVIRLHLPDLFPGMELEQAAVFRVTRNSEYEIDDDEVEDLLKTIEEEVRKRRRGVAVRLEIEADAPPEVEQFLMQALDLDPLDVYPHAAACSI